MSRHIFVTGQPGVGKSTLIQRILQQLQLPPGTATGFFTEEVRSSSGERQGFDVVTLSGQRAPLSRTGTASKVCWAVLLLLLTWMGGI
jgi:nucleoside-triphosphatase